MSLEHCEQQVSLPGSIGRIFATSSRKISNFSSISFLSCDLSLLPAQEDDKEEGGNRRVKQEREVCRNSMRACAAAAPAAKEEQEAGGG